ncbi:MAG: amidohydrolase [Candidatus Eisenbacteria bacterium]|nr:amidohydrolase [Candidatus Eisenbacteria bacterium]
MAVPPSDKQPQAGRAGDARRISPRWRRNRASEGGHVARTLLDDARKLGGKLSKIRRQIHMYPELGYQEKRTSALIAKTLKSMGIEVRTGVAKTGVVGLLRGGRAGKTIALRADMDALPITERTNKPYRSRVDGVMHACGHDANTTTVLGAAMLLGHARDEISGNVKFIFQPSEESPPGGAAAMIKQGALRKPRVDAIIGVHVDPSVPVGKMGVRDGPMMAAADDFSFSVLGEAAHGAKPHLGVDAIALSAQVITALQTIASRRVNPVHPAVVTVGTIEGGYRRNVIADRVYCEGTARTLNARDRRRVEKMIGQTIARVARSGGGDHEYDYQKGYPALECDPVVTDIVRRATADVLGKRGVVEIDEPSMGGEDFAYFVNEVPGMMVRVGTGNKKKGITHSWHSPKFDVDEDGIWTGAAVVARAVRMCQEEL